MKKELLAKLALEDAMALIPIVMGIIDNRKESSTNPDQN